MFTHFLGCHWNPRLVIFVAFRRWAPSTEFAKTRKAENMSPLFISQELSYTGRAVRHLLGSFM